MSELNTAYIPAGSVIIDKTNAENGIFITFLLTGGHNEEVQSAVENEHYKFKLPVLAIDEDAYTPSDLMNKWYSYWGEKT